MNSKNIIFTIFCYSFGEYKDILDTHSFSYIRWTFNVIPQSSIIIIFASTFGNNNVLRWLFLLKRPRVRLMLVELMLIWLSLFLPQLKRIKPWITWYWWYNYNSTKMILQKIAVLCTSTTKESKVFKALKHSYDPWMTPLQVLTFI